MNRMAKIGMAGVFGWALGGGSGAWISLLKRFCAADRLVLWIGLVAVSLVIGCAGPAKTQPPECEGLEEITDSSGLISRETIEARVMGQTHFGAPSTPSVEVERVVAICLTTPRSFYVHLPEGVGRPGPEGKPPSMPIWMVEMKGVSTPEGIGEGGRNMSFKYVVTLINAETGEVVGGSRPYGTDGRGGRR